MRVEYRPEAGRAVIEAAQWYEREASVERALDFLEAIDRQIEQITRTPFQSAVRLGDVRRRNMPVYPYGIYYRVADDLITILAIRHHSREPLDWEERDG